MGSQLTPAQQAELEATGTLSVDPRRPFIPGKGGMPVRTWYDRYGRAKRLPSDPASVQRWMAKGFTTTPPANPEPVPPPPPETVQDEGAPQPEEAKVLVAEPQPIREEERQLRLL